MLDSKDLAILDELKKDARKPVVLIADALEIPRATVQERIRKLKQAKVIRRFTVAPNYAALGLPVTAFILVSFLPTAEVSQRKLAEQIAKLEGIYEVHVISGEWDIMLKVRGQSMQEIGGLVIDKLRAIPGVGKTVTCACFTTVKEEM